MESPSGASEEAKAALDACGAAIAGEFAAEVGAGARANAPASASGDGGVTAPGPALLRHPLARQGDAFEVRLAPDPPASPPAEHSRRRRVLLLGHYDTVHPLGSLATAPFRATGERVYGPGVLDMKGGLAAVFAAFAALRDCGIAPARGARLLLVGDEEIGSPASRPITEAAAEAASEVWVLEPGAGLEGRLKTARKGIADFSLVARGAAAHSGLDFERGVNAVVELAHQATRLAAMSDAARGLTVNVGRLCGGERVNVVPAEATLAAEARAWRGEDLAGATAEILALRAQDPRAHLEIRGGINRPPMERSPAAAALFGRARGAGKRLGLALEECAVGGASDGNFTAALGVPTLDGLGVVGEGAHTGGEFILAESLASRAALLALLLAT